MNGIRTIGAIAGIVVFCIVILSAVFWVSQQIQRNKFREIDNRIQQIENGMRFRT